MATDYIRGTPNAGLGAERLNGQQVFARRVSVEEAFHATLTLERRRAERCRKAFALMLLDAHQENGTARMLLHRAAESLKALIRETDPIGWYEDGGILGVLFTEIGEHSREMIAEVLRTKVRNRLEEHLGLETASKIAVSLHIFPEHWDSNDSGRIANSTLYPELKSQTPGRAISQAIKRVMDIAASGFLLLLLSPILAAVAAIIKLTSQGPVLYGQERLGQFGARFKCLKFRSMYVNNKPTIHKEYMRQFIAGKDQAPAAGDAPVVYKITNDPRVTPAGRFLRKTSLDELPQLWNVLVGDMSLVGPRPPVPYEFEMYEYWHRRRVLEVKPGITGLWQVSGRSRTTFDEMVRLDLRYCRSWSLWLDLKILLMTPKAVFSGSGAH